jgi:hypothetical protein
MNQVIIFLGVALFLILVAATLYLIFMFGDTSTVFIIIGLVGVVACGIAAAIAVSVYTTNLMPEIRTKINILNLSLCDNQSMPCHYSAFPYDNNITIFWQVDNGIGCCATYNCNYTAFSQTCLIPTFKLYDIYLDDVKHTWEGFNVSEYDYNCSNNIPWNYFYYYNVSLGEHEIKIEQKDCTNVILATANIKFILSQVEDIYVLELIE